MAVTIKDIARIAGVTHSTVSRCLNEKPGVSPAKREEIKKIARDLGFEYNANARSLNTSKTGTIGIILNDDADDDQPHFYTNTFLKHIRHQLEEGDLDILTTFKKNVISNKDNIIRLVNRRKVDGFIILSSSIEKKTLEFLKKGNIPFVFSHQIPPLEAGSVNAVYCDHETGGYMATRCLLDKGRRKILCLCRPEDRREFSLRTLGYRKALEEYGIGVDESLIIQGINDLEKIDEMWETLSPYLNRIDAVFAHTDIMGIVLIKALEKRGIAVPGDIAVVGYDNIGLCSFVEPNLTSVAQPSKAISVQTCELLIDLLSGRREARKVVIPPELVIRDSV